MVVKAITVFVGLIGAVIAALTAYAVVAKVAAAATALLTAAIPGVNIIMGVSVAVAAITAGIVALTSAADDGVPSVKELTEAARAMSDTMDAATATYDEAVTSTLAAANVADNYISKLEEMEAAGINTNEEHRQYHNTLALLCQVVPELAEYIDLETNTIHGGTEALRANTEAWKQNAMQKAYQSQLTALYESYSAVLIEAEKNSIGLTNAQYELDAANQKYNDTLTRMDTLYADAAAQAEAMNEEYLGWADATSFLTVNSILTNEKYKGDALLQKRFTVDFLMKTMKVNEGEVPQYYVENSHPSIIDPIDWGIVQAEITRRKTLGRTYSGNSVFSSRLVCGDCGSFFGQKVWHSNDAYRKVIWRCNGKFKGEKKCTTPHLEIETIQQKFLFAYNQLMQNRDGVINDCNQIRQLVSDCTALDAEIDKLTEEIEVLAEMVKACVKENAASVQSQEEYTKKYNALVKRYEKTSARLDALAAEKSRKQDRDRELRLFIESIKKQPLVLEVWSERLWVGLLDKTTVFHDGRMVFQFKNGTEIEVGL